MKILLFTVLFVLGYFTTKLTCWANMVAVPYMELAYETQRCNRYEAADQNNELAKANSLDMIAATCSFDEEACDKIDVLREKYENSRITFIKWFPL